MIRYALKCESGHEFEAWFASSETFDKQAKQGQVGCPVCGSHSVSKSVMAPNVSSRSAAKREKVVAMVRELREQVTQNSDNVGDQFATEARKIHYKETEPRSIYGSATADEAKELSEEGVEFHPLPTLPEEHN